MNHPDLQGVQWTSACNMVDEGAQEVDFPPAYLEDGISPSDAIKTRRSVDDYCWSSTPIETVPVHGHGTIVTGIIAAIHGNGVGISGAGYAADNSMFKIMPVKVLNSAGEGDPITVAYGIYYAVMMGANVINLSLGGPAGTITPPEMQHAIEYALDHNVVVVAAAGNDYAAQVSPPANMRDVIAVGAATIWGTPASYSNHGPGLDLVAPGGGQISSLILASTTGPESGVVNANAIALTSNAGVFEISTLPAGKYSYFYAWIDTDLNDRINNGDYYDVVGPLLLRKNSSDMLRLQLHAYSGPDIAVQWRQARY
jgi:subtilisin family serine protease